VQLGKYEATGLNPEAFEIGLGELIAGGLIYAPQWGATYFGEKNRELTEAQRKRKRSAPSIRW